MTPRFVDEHRTVIAAPRDRVWAALRAHLDASLLKDRDNPLLRLLGTDPRRGFALSSEEPGTEVRLTGRHRFSRYELVFRATPLGDGSTELAALTFADFPGVHGRVYRALVVDSRAHVLAVRGMLRAIRRSV